VTDAGYSILGKRVVRIGDPAMWARQDELVARARSALGPDDEAVALALVDLLGRYGRACEARDGRREALADEVTQLGRALCGDGGSERMKLVAYRVEVLGASHPDDMVRDYLNVRQLEHLWDGVCGWQH
jgi:hypothetical protein